MVDGEARPKGSYQVVLVTLLSANFGILFLDRNALGFLIDFVKEDIQLDNARIGLLSSALAFAWAISGFLVGRWSDRLERRKIIIVVATVAFSLCSVFSSFATSFGMLLAARLLMGLAEGGVLPVSQSLVMAAVPPARRGLSMGLMQNFGSQLIGSFVAPVLLTAVALAYGWRNAFLVAGIPGLICACLILWFVKDPPRTSPPAKAAADGRNLSALQVLRRRNIWVCALIAVLMVSYLFVCLTFMKLFLVEVRGFETTVAAGLIGALGLSAIVSSFLVPGLSDRFGRRPIMVLTPMVGIVLPLAAMYWQGPTWSLAALFMIGWLPLGCFPLFMAAIPSEAVEPRQMATALGVVMGLGEILGGVLGPYGAGLAADAAGLGVTLWIMIALAVGSAALALLLKESAPRFAKA